MLNVNQLCGFGAGNRLPISFTHIGTVSDSTTQTTYTYTAAAIGVADPTRRVVIFFHWQVTNSALTVNSATIGGIAATIHTQTTTGPTSAQGDTGCAILSALVPTGTTANVVVTLSGAASRSLIGVTTQYNESITAPFNVMAPDNTMSSGVLSATMNIPEQGLNYAACTGAGASGGSWTWSGNTERYDAPHAGAAGLTLTGAVEGPLAAQTGRTIQATLVSTPSRGAEVAMSWV